MHVLITNPAVNGPTKRLEPGERQEFGRGTGGVGRMADDVAISRRHGEIIATDVGFSVRSTGRFNGFAIVDDTTPSRLHVPCGLGPVDVPFRDCSIAVESSVGASELRIEVVGSDQADRWAEQWGIEAEHRSASEPMRTEGVLSDLAGNRRPEQFKKTNGAYYTWFTILVALCEPALRLEQGSTPSNPQLAARTGYKVGDIERKLSAIFHVLEVEHEHRLREIAVNVALARGIVTRDHLELLPAR